MKCLICDKDYKSELMFDEICISCSGVDDEDRREDFEQKLISQYINSNPYHT